MSVENFFQESIFDDIFPAVPATANFQKSRSPRPSPISQVGASEPSLPEFRVVRSARRKRGVSAFRNNGVIEIHIPDRTSRRAERELIPEVE